MSYPLIAFLVVFTLTVIKFSVPRWDSKDDVVGKAGLTVFSGFLGLVLGAMASGLTHLLFMNVDCVNSTVVEIRVCQTNGYCQVKFDDGSIDEVMSPVVDRTYLVCRVR